jgi:3-phenylpropionate/trans-cinnamate dioxygenase ferredoxin component
MFRRQIESMSKTVKVAQISELSPGERKIVEVDGTWIAVFNVGGKYHAIEDVCTHDDGPVAEGELDGYEIECPRHGARFDIRDGKVLSFPAIKPVQSFNVQTEGDDILVEMP